MSSEIETQPVRQVSRSWLRLTLRTLLLGVAAFGVGLGWYVSRVHRQRNALAALRQYGDGIYYFRGSSSWLADWTGRDFVDQIKFIDLFRPSIPDHELAHVRALAGLKQLRLPGTSVSDSGLVEPR